MRPYIQVLFLMTYFSMFSLFSGYSQTRFVKTNLEAQKKMEDLKKLKHEKKQALKSKLDSLASLEHYEKGFKNQLNSRFKVFNQLYKKGKNDLKIKKPKSLEVNTIDFNATQQFANRTGIYPADAPASFSRLNLDANIDLWSLPFKTQWFYSTEQESYRQNMNRFSISLDVKSIQNRMKQKVTERMNEIEKAVRPERLVNMDKLYKLYDVKGLDFNLKNSQNLKDYLKEYQVYDSLQNIDWRGKTDQYLKQAQDSAQQMMNQNKGKLEKKAQNKLEKSVKKKTKKQRKDFKKEGKKKLEQGKSAKKNYVKIKKFLKKENLDANKLKKLVEAKDSLERIDVERLLGFESLITLKKIQEGKSINSVELLQNTDLLPFSGNFFNKVKTFEIGTSFPVYTAYTLKNMPITGLNVEAEPGPFYVAFTGSKNLRPLPDQRIFRREIQAGRIGIGKKDHNHVHITFLRASDHKGLFGGDTLVIIPGDSTFYDKPRKNYVLSTDFQYSINDLKVEFELARSLTSLNTFEEELSFGDWTNHNQEGVSRSDVIQTGWASSLKLSYQWKENTLLSLKGEYIDPFFYSLGVPFLRNDLFGGEFKLEQKFWNKQLSIAPSYGRWKDNNDSEKNTTAWMTTYGLDLSLTPPKWPYLTLNYLYTAIDGQERNQVQSYQATLGHNYSLWGVNFQTTLNASWNESLSFLNNDLLSDPDIFTKTISLTQIASFRNSLELTWTTSYVEEEDGQHQAYLRRFNQGAFSVELKPIGLLRGQWVNTEVSARYNFLGIWENSLTYLRGIGELGGWRQSLKLTSKVPVFNRLNLIFEFESNIVNASESNLNYNESLGRIIVNYQF